MLGFAQRIRALRQVLLGHRGHTRGHPIGEAGEPIMTRYWLQRRQRVLRRYRRSQSGVTAIEFAFAAPLFSHVAAGDLRSGDHAVQRVVIQNGVSDASRMIRTGEVKSESDFKAQVCGRLATYLDCEGQAAHRRAGVSLISMT
jgi:Flp pilus assembly protein TadG